MAGVLLLAASSGCGGTIEQPASKGDTGAAHPQPTGLVATTVARRLSRAELDNSLRDLLGDTTAPASRLLPEDAYAPYDNDYAGQLASSAWIDSLEALASDVAGRAVSDGAARARLVPCTPSGVQDAACFERVIAGLGRRAFRRPLAPAEVATYLELLRVASADAQQVRHDFYTAVGLLVRAVVQDPEFLYRIERGEFRGDISGYALDDYEIAVRMSYLLWGTTPDDALLEQASAGGLRDRAARIERAREMLARPLAREQLHRFHGMWLGYRTLPHPPALTAAFQRETNALIDRVVFDHPQRYFTLFTAEQSYLDRALAEHYGLAAPVAGAAWVDYGQSGRAGILSHGSVLAAFSKFTDTSPTQRGIFVRTRLLCEPLLPPPPNADSDNPPGDKDAVCKSQRYAAHRTSSACAGCHSQLDPIGFGLEQYDIAGRWRSHDDGLPQCPIDGKGELAGHGTFRGPRELGQLLVNGALIAPCVVRQLAQFALGRAPQADDQPLLSELEAAFAASDYQLGELLIAYVARDQFVLRREPEAP